ncbi:oligosaccharide repeat unit polymerase [Fervidobacterium islandicum]|uniref:Oligosaccharide repeat unit polymerase n=2 Tax=Fervidobacterium TaxID=2422 RepID=A0AAI8CJZ6_FERIS|nr:O-antigen polymerase [Fervidobacterium islandicum]AMW31977.2 oligosaccharide repeat unit polymerase [Fervidobacterium islandicum]
MKKLLASNSRCTRSAQIYDSKVLFIIIAIIVSYTAYLTLLTPKLNPGLHWVAILTFLLNGSFFLIQLATISPLGFSLKEIYYLFMVIFMFVAPLIQYISGQFPWWDTYLLTNERIIYANILILLFTVLFELTYIKTNERAKTFLGKIFQKEIKHHRLYISWLLIVSAFYFAYLLREASTIVLLFSRGTYGEVFTDVSQPVMLILNITFGGISVHLLAYVIATARKRASINRILLALASLLVILENFPTGRARFWTGAVYLGIFIVWKRTFKKKNLFKVIFIVSFIILFPLLNLFRAQAINEALGSNIKPPTILETITTGDFDAYSMFVRTIAVVHEEGPTNGRQLLGNLLFFVPRSMWQNKPVGSGHEIAQRLGWSFTNVSCPLVGEAYINFGILGIPLFAIALGYVTKKLDSLYYGSIVRFSSNVLVIELLYPFYIGFLFFILRGDLLSSLSYTIGFSIPVFVEILFEKILPSKLLGRSVVNWEKSVY